MPERFDPNTERFDPTTELTHAFYDWEAWGRGWLRANEPIDFAPPPGWPSWHLPRTNQPDDTRRAPFFERWLARKQPTTRPSLPQPERSVSPVAPRQDLLETTILLPADARFSPGLARVWLGTLPALIRPLSFEVLRTNGQSELRLAYAPEAHALVSSALRSVNPDLRLAPALNLSQAWESATRPESSLTAGFEFALARECLLPLGESVDGLTPLLSALNELDRDEAALWQVMLVPADTRWPTTIEYASVSPTGHPVMADLPELGKLSVQKASEPLFAVVVRLLLRVQTPERCFSLVRAVLGSLNVVRGLNSLVPLSDTDLDTLPTDVLTRVSRRLGMVLALSELASLVTLPHVSQPAGLRLLSDRPAVPQQAVGTSLGLVDGEQLRLSLTDRFRHLHVIGASGTGKSNLLLHLMLQDAAAGHGLALVDPHGDLARDLVARLPEKRRADVVIVDPSAATERVIGWNALDAEREGVREILASDFVSVFRRLSTSWGDRMTAVLANAVLVMLAVNQVRRPREQPALTLVDLRQFLRQERTRVAVLSELPPTERHLQGFWQDEYRLLSGNRAQVPILTRLDTLLRHRRVRELLCVARDALDFRQVIDAGQILVVRLPQGLLGRENASLIGSLLVSRLHQAVLSRSETEVGNRAPFFLYLDEFHEQATASMTTMFSGLRKYQVGLCVAHHDYDQLKRVGEGLERAVATNTHVRLAFRVDDDDARRLERGFRHHEAFDLTSLPVGQAVVRVGRSDQDYRLQVPLVPEVSDVSERYEVALQESLEQYGVEREVRESPSVTTVSPAAAESKPTATEAVRPAPSSTPPAEIVSEAVPARVEASTENPPTQDSSTPETVPDAPDGRGGPEHRYLQSLIRSWAQERGFKVDLEVETESGARADLVIGLPDDERLVVEVSVSTSRQHELQHVERYLNEGFARVAVVSPRARFRREFRTALEGIEGGESVGVYAPDEFLSLLQSLPRETQKVAGYTVRSTVSASPSGESAADRRERLNRVIAGGLKRLREN